MGNEKNLSALKTQLLKLSDVELIAILRRR